MHYKPPTQVYGRCHDTHNDLFQPITDTKSLHIIQAGIFPNEQQFFLMRFAIEKHHNFKKKTK